MKNMPFLVFITLCTLAVLSTLNIESSEKKNNLALSSTLAKTEVAERSRLLKNGFTRVVRVWPTEVYLGDPVYFCAYYENRSGATIPQCGDYIFSRGPEDAYIAWNWIAWGFRLSDATATYRLFPELECEPAWIELGLSRRDYLPNESAESICGTLELPPLEDLRSEFWKSLSAAPEEGVECELRSIYDDISFKIRVKPRPTGEAERLQRWYDATPPALFPIVPSDRKLKIPRDDKILKSSGKSDIKLGFFKRYDPWLFVRVGNRKPSDPNNPTTLDGWRKLEAEFAPSTLRDEITLTRLQLEYYDADKGEASDAALKTLIDWLSQRPEPQRVVLSQSLLSKRGKFRGTPLETKNATLCDALTSAFSVETPATSDIK